jgi:hypothetical protein
LFMLVDEQRLQAMCVNNSEALLQKLGIACDETLVGSHDGGGRSARLGEGAPMIDDDGVADSMWTSVQQRAPRKAAIAERKQPVSLGWAGAPGRDDWLRLLGGSREKWPARDSGRKGDSSTRALFPSRFGRRLQQEASCQCPVPSPPPVSPALPSPPPPPAVSSTVSDARPNFRISAGFPTGRRDSRFARTFGVRMLLAHALTNAKLFSLDHHHHRRLPLEKNNRCFENTRHRCVTPK